jgi:hypothetical protein
LQGEGRAVCQPTILRTRLPCVITRNSRAYILTLNSAPRIYQPQEIIGRIFSKNSLRSFNTLCRQLWILLGMLHRVFSLGSTRNIITLSHRLLDLMEIRHRIFSPGGQLRLREMYTLRNRIFLPIIIRRRIFSLGGKLSRRSMYILDRSIFPQMVTLCRMCQPGGFLTERLRDLNTCSHRVFTLICNQGIQRGHQMVGPDSKTLDTTLVGLPTQLTGKYVRLELQIDSTWNLIILSVKGQCAPPHSVQVGNLLKI